MKNGLYANIHKKRERIKSGSGESMRKPGTKGAPTAKAFKESAKTVKRKTKQQYAVNEINIAKSIQTEC